MIIIEDLTEFSQFHQRRSPDKPINLIEAYNFTDAQCTLRGFNAFMKGISPGSILELKKKSSNRCLLYNYFLHGFSYENLYYLNKILIQNNNHEVDLKDLYHHLDLYDTYQNFSYGCVSVFGRNSIYMKLKRVNGKQIRFPILKGYHLQK